MPKSELPLRPPITTSRLANATAAGLPSVCGCKGWLVRTSRTYQE
jgi:hypothetical protein